MNIKCSTKYVDIIKDVHIDNKVWTSNVDILSTYVYKRAYVQHNVCTCVQMHYCFVRKRTYEPKYI